MMKNKCVSLQLAAVFTVGLTTSTVLSAPVDWGVGAQNISGDSDVSTAGTLVDAFVLGPSGTSATTVNGVTFSPYVLPDFSYDPASSTNSVTSGNYNLTENLSYSSGSIVFNYSGLGTGTGAYSTLSSTYQTLLGTGGGSGAPSTLVLTISGLTLGQTYQFQWWNNNSSLTLSQASFDPINTVATAGNDVTLLGNNGSVGSLGQFAIGTFTADDVTQEIDFNGSTSGNDPMLNAFQLRDLNPAPEPSTLALAGIGGVSALVMLRRRK